MGKFKDLTGQKFGRWLVLNYAGRHNERTMFLCRCDCGVERTVGAGDLVNGSSTCCGCSLIRDLAGHKFGRLTVIRLFGRPNGVAWWWVKCDCGKEKALPGGAMTTGNTTSCGCRAIETIRQLGKRNNWSKTHGEGGITVEYEAWNGMQDRCYCPTTRGYENWGGKGIQVCDGLMDYPHFLKIMGRRPPDKHCTDRIENLLHYSCGECPQCIKEGWKMNVHWATWTESNNNKRNNRILEFQDKKDTLANWARKVGIAPHTIWGRLKRGWSVEKTLTTPTKKPDSKILPGS